MSYLIVKATPTPQHLCHSSSNACLQDKQTCLQQGAVSTKRTSSPRLVVVAGLLDGLFGGSKSPKVPWARLFLQSATLQSGNILDFVCNIPSCCADLQKMPEQRSHSMSWLQGDCCKQACAKAVTSFDFQYVCRGPVETGKMATCLRDGSKPF